jgi:hypothetical protein
VKKVDTSNVRIPGTNLRGGRAIAVGVLGVYVLLFVLLNRRHVEVNFVFFKIRGNELLALVLVLALGFAAGFIVRGRRQAARPREEPPATLEAGTDDDPLPSQPQPAEHVGRGPAGPDP